MAQVSEETIIQVLDVPTVPSVTFTRSDEVDVLVKRFLESLVATRHFWTYCSTVAFSKGKFSFAQLRDTVDGLADYIVEKGKTFEESIRRLVGCGVEADRFMRGLLSYIVSTPSTPASLERASALGVAGFCITGPVIRQLLPAKGMTFYAWWKAMGMQKGESVTFTVVGPKSFSGKTWVARSAAAKIPAGAGVLNWTIAAEDVLGDSSHPLYQFTTYMVRFCSGAVLADTPTVDYEAIEHCKKTCKSFICGTCAHCLRCGRCCHGLRLERDIGERCRVCPEPCQRTQALRLSSQTIKCSRGKVGRDKIVEIQNEVWGAKQRLIKAMLEASGVSGSQLAGPNGVLPFAQVHLIYKNKGFRTPWHVDCHDNPHAVFCLGISGMSEFLIASHRVTYELRSLAHTQSWEDHRATVLEMCRQGKVKRISHCPGQLLVISPAEGHCVSTLGDGTVFAAIEVPIEVDSEMFVKSQARAVIVHEKLTAALEKFDVKSFNSLLAVLQVDSNIAELDADWDVVSPKKSSKKRKKSTN